MLTRAPSPQAPHLPSTETRTSKPSSPQVTPNSQKEQGLQKYFSVQDVCEACNSESQPHFDLWMGVPSYSDGTQLGICAGDITVSDATAAVIVNPNDGYYVDPTHLMSGTGTCDTNADYSRTQPVLASGGAGTGSKGVNSNGSPTTLATVVSPSASTSAGDGSVSSSKSRGSGHCGWKGHCRGAPCQSDTDCADPFSCVNNVCT